MGASLNIIPYEWCRYTIIAAAQCLCQASVQSGYADTQILLSSFDHIVVSA